LKVFFEGRIFSRLGELRRNHRELFEVLAEFYRVDPLRWFEGKAGSEARGDSRPSQSATVREQSKTTDAPGAEESGFIDFSCPYCRKPVAFPKSDSGKLKECPNCLEAMIVPESAGRAAERIPFPVRTERLVLRRFQAVDAKDLAGVMSDAATLRYLAADAMSLEDAEEWIAEQSRARFPKPGGRCSFAIEASQAAKVIGMTSFWFVPKWFNLARFEIIIHPDWQRKRYGVEAVRGLLGYAFKGLRVRRVGAECDARNLAARRLLLKAGLRQESEGIADRFRKEEWVNTVGFALLRKEYEENISLHGQRQVSEGG
jgi:RimJ/RimL family protein N-acetyltransferase